MIWIWGVSTAVAAGALATGYALGGYWAWGAVWIALGSLWGVGRSRWSWTGSAFFLSFIIAAVVGFWLDLSAGWMLVGTIAALSAWDLDAFTRQLRVVDRVEQESELVRTHLRQLALVSGAGLLLGSVALVVQVDLSLGVALLLGLLVIIGLRQFLTALRRESD